MVRLTLNTLLDELQVPRAGILYVQSSTDWLQKAGFSAADTLTTLIEWTRPSGTLVMPTYPFRVTHAEYLATHPRYDVRRTPAAIGLIPEVFRRSTGVRRSLDPDFSVAALGAAAEEVVATDRHDEDPFGPASVYTRLIQRGATLVGLGVSLNTNSFIHVIDSRLSPHYPRPVYSGRQPADVTGYDGLETTVWRKALVPDFQRLTQPSAVVETAAPGATMFASRSLSGAMFFRWNLALWAQWCDVHARAAADGGTWPCWLSRLSSGTSA